MIRKEMIFADAPFENKKDVIEAISAAALKQGLISDAESFKAKVFEREAQVSTSVGSSVAIPHGKSNAVSEPFIAFMRTAENFKWDEENTETVRLIFLIGVPAEKANKLHLKYIAAISKKLINDEFREKLLNLTTQHELFSLLESINAA